MVVSPFQTALGGLVALAALLATTAGNADAVPEQFPPGVGPFWFGESMKSAQRKCETFESVVGVTTPKIASVDCALKGTRYRLGFRANGKLKYVGFGTTPAGYDECAKSIFAAIGLKGRSEDSDGHEIWTVGYTGAKNESLGTVTCFQTDDGSRMFVIAK